MWWRADYIETCNCAHVCPCKFTMIPTQGQCHGVDAFHIREGECDDLRLDGLNVSLVFAWPVGPASFSVDGRRAQVGLGELASVKVGPTISDIGGSEANARLVMPEGFIFKDGAIVNVDDARVRGAGLEFDYRNCSAFIAEVAYN